MSCGMQQSVLRAIDFIFHAHLDSAETVRKHADGKFFSKAEGNPVFTGSLQNGNQNACRFYFVIGNPNLSQCINPGFFHPSDIVGMMHDSHTVRFIVLYFTSIILDIDHLCLYSPFFLLPSSGCSVLQGVVRKAGIYEISKMPAFPEFIFRMNKSSLRQHHSLMPDMLRLRCQPGSYRPSPAVPDGI